MVVGGCRRRIILFSSIVWEVYWGRLFLEMLLPHRCENNDFMVNFMGALNLFVSDEEFKVKLDLSR